MRKTKLIKHLEQLGEEDLREEILHLFDHIKDVKSYYAMELGSEADRKKRYDKAKADIASKFVSRSRRRVKRPRVNKTHQIIKELERQTVFPHEMIDIYLYTCEEALKFSARYQYVSQPLINLVRKYYQKAESLTIESAMEADFGEALRRLRIMSPLDFNLK